MNGIKTNKQNPAFIPRLVALAKGININLLTKKEINYE